MTHNNSKLQKSLECNETKTKLCGMDHDDERCKSGPIKPLNISRTLCHPYLATLVGIALCKVIMSQNGDITIGVPHPWARAPCLVHSLMPIIVTLCGCVGGFIQSLRCSHVAEGKRIQSLGMLPSCPALSQTQPKSPSIVLRQVRCVPPWAGTSALCHKVLLLTPKRLCLPN
jgi:hypothetical protein